MIKIINILPFLGHIAISMRVFSAIILILALCIQLFTRFLVELQYDLNKNYIAKHLCEDRGNPMSCCRGKCFLKKQLANNDKAENSPCGELKKDSDEILLFSQENKSLDQTGKLISKAKNLDLSTCFVPQLFCDATFHPPEV